MPVKRSTLVTVGRVEDVFNKFDDYLIPNARYLSTLSQGFCNHLVLWGQVISWPPNPQPGGTGGMSFAWSLSFDQSGTVETTRGPFLDDPEKFSDPESHNKNLKPYVYRAVLFTQF